MQAGTTVKSTSFVFQVKSIQYSKYHIICITKDSKYPKYCVNILREFDKI